MTISAPDNGTPIVTAPDHCVSMRGPLTMGACEFAHFHDDELTRFSWQDWLL